MDSQQVKDGYKLTEVGVIPDDWEVKSLDDIAHIERGKFTARPRNDPKYYGGNIPFIQTGDVSNSNGLIKSFSQTLNDEGLKVSKVFFKGTLFFTIAANIGDVAFADFDTACPDSLVAITARPFIFNQWLAHELRNRKKSFENLATQNAQLNINLEKLKPYLIPIPSSIAEQNKIAEVLTDVDELIETLEEVIAKKRLIKQGTMQELLTGKRRLKGFGDEWKIKSFDTLFDFSGGFSASRSQLSSEGYCYLHYGDIHTSSKNYVNVSQEYLNIPKLNITLKKISPVSLLKDGDVVFVDASEDDEGVSKYIVIENKDNIPYISGLHTIVAKPKTDELNKLYLRYCFQTNNIKKQFYYFAVGTKVTGISKTNIRKITISIPSIEEQKAIADILTEMDEEITALEEKLEKTRQLKQGMMQELLTGKIRLV